MTVICPKCRTVRPANTQVPDWQCPHCGVAYAKAGGDASQLKRPSRYTQSVQTADSEGIPWFKLLAGLLIGWALYAGYQATTRQDGPSWLGGGFSEQQIQTLASASKTQDVLFYTADWCPYCRAAKGWLEQYGFKYQECDIDKQPECAQQLKDLGSSGVPYFIVKGKHLKNGFDSDAFLTAMQQKK